MFLYLTLLFFIELILPAWLTNLYLLIKQNYNLNSYYKISMTVSVLLIYYLNVELLEGSNH